MHPHRRPQFHCNRSPLPCRTPTWLRGTTSPQRLFLHRSNVSSGSTTNLFHTSLRPQFMVPPSCGPPLSAAALYYPPAQKPDLPPFNQANPCIWFAIVDSIFHFLRIHENDTKFALLVSHLHNFTELFSDIILDPPAHDKYVALKQAISERAACSKNELLHQAIYHKPPGDQSLSQYWRYLRAMVPKEALPDYSLWTIDAKLLLADEAYVLFKSHQPVAGSNRVSSNNHYIFLQDVMHSSPTEVGNSAHAATQPATCASIKPHTKPTAPGTGSSARQTDDSTASTNSNRALSSICWYHATFGDKATKCRTPCYT
ncbi:uncharacterized protein LOC126470768 [Schistocerca serialis cubense]|uniref:uncharacterized protein LOC126470768 n=1 Tax=Schistocerca serialis cubense TaxID=2023355 RepID=UPI00214E682D|nr:uncharacterized protein LOC126470768 [Schistocerca serialis cubense]